MYTGKYYYDDEQFKLIKGDTFKVLKKFEDKTIDTIFADPPYFLSNDGTGVSERPISTSPSLPMPLWRSLHLMAVAVGSAILYDDVFT